MGGIVSIMAPGAVFARLSVATRKQAILALGAPLARAARLDPSQVCEAVMARERLAGSGIGEGVAIPHAQIAGLRRAWAGFARLDPPADFRALDRRPADIVFLLISPPGPEHLKALAALARFVRRPEAREQLRAAQEAEAVLGLLAGERAGAAA